MNTSTKACTFQQNGSPPPPTPTTLGGKGEGGGTIGKRAKHGRSVSTCGLSCRQKDSTITDSFLLLYKCFPMTVQQLNLLGLKNGHCFIKTLTKGNGTVSRTLWISSPPSMSIECVSFKGGKCIFFRAAMRWFFNAFIKRYKITIWYISTI